MLRSLRMLQITASRLPTRGLVLHRTWRMCSASSNVTARPNPSPPCAPDRGLPGGTWSTNTLVTLTSLSRFRSENQTLYHRPRPRTGVASTHSERSDCRILLLRALVAQRIEHLTTDQKVGGSNPFERATISPAQ